MIATPGNARAYKVGGAVRDALLGITPHDTDWVVVGSDPDAMLQAGFLPVGKDFPVFMHPETREEYALARTERKSGKGYHGFVFHADASVKLEDDLRRRDFTMNAVAEDADGTLIDPFDGVRDIRNRVIRHVSSAFSEDPLRVLRAARFAARFHHLGFTVAAETLELMQQFSQGDELRALSAERVWMEIASTLEGRDSHVFFQVLHDTHCLKVILPEVDILFGVPQPEKWHPEIDTGIHILLCLQQIEKLSPHLAVRFATLVHDVGKAATPAALLPKHHGHETRGLPIIRELCARLRVPNDCRELALAVAEFHTHVHKAAELRPETKLKVLERIGAFRKPVALENLLLACEADARGRTGLEDRPYPQADLFRAAFRAANAITMASIDSSDLEGAAIGKAIHQARIKAIEMTAG